MLPRDNSHVRGIGLWLCFRPWKEYYLAWQFVRGGAPTIRLATSVSRKKNEYQCLFPKSLLCGTLIPPIGLYQYRNLLADYDDDYWSRVRA